MYNLPTDSVINGMGLFHEGNHVNKGNPHDNYISKYACAYTLNIQGNSNKYMKIASIKYIPNSNVEYRYVLELFSNKIDTINRITLFCNKTPENTTCKFEGHNNIDVALKTSNNGTNNIIDIYIKIKQSWAKVYYRVNFARCLEYSNIFDEESAYKSITLLKEQPLIDNVTSDIVISYIRPIQYLTIDTDSKLFDVNADIKFQLSVPGVTKNSYIISCTPVGDIPLDFIIHSIYVAWDNEIIVRIKNHGSTTQILPYLKWNISYRNLF